MSIIIGLLLITLVIPNQCIPMDFPPKDVLKVGSSCTFRGKEGVCTSMIKCESIVSALYQKTMNYSDTIRCGFEGKDEIICCPDVDTRRISVDEPKESAKPSPPKMGSRAVDACVKYTNDLPAFLDENILGGSEAGHGEFPHMAAFGYEEANKNMSWNCAGSLISDRFILTAAHCVSNRSDLPKIIRLGQNVLGSTEEYVDSVFEIIISHPEYKLPLWYNDIALIRLAHPVNFTRYIRPACLHTSLKDNPAETQFIATGWGVTNPDTQQKSNVLMKVNLSLVEHFSCNKTFGSPTFERPIRFGLIRGQMCAHAVGKDSCSGDSGGPLQIVDVNQVSLVVGITSFGSKCGSNLPAVYTRVERYIEWIEDHVWPL